MISGVVKMEEGLGATSDGDPFVLYSISCFIKVRT